LKDPPKGKGGVTKSHFTWISNITNTSSQRKREKNKVAKSGQQGRGAGKRTVSIRTEKERKKSLSAISGEKGERETKAICFDKGTSRTRKRRYEEDRNRGSSDLSV